MSDKAIPQKPPETLSRLYDFGLIQGIHVDYRQTGDDTADTFVVLKSSSGKEIRGKWDTYKKYLCVGVTHAYIAELKDHYRQMVIAWRKYEKSNRAELAEYYRLKRKYE